MIKRLLLIVLLLIPTLAWGTDKPINFYSRTVDTLDKPINFYSRPPEMATVDSDTAFLINFNGTNGGQDFTDEAHGATVYADNPLGVPDGVGLAENSYTQKIEGVGSGHIGGVIVPGWGWASDAIRTDDNAYIGDAISSNEYTIQGWVYFDSDNPMGGSDDLYLVQVNGHTSFGFPPSIRFGIGCNPNDGNKPYMFLRSQTTYGDSGGYYADVSSVFTNKTWHHLRFVARHPSELEYYWDFYFDGNLITTVNATPSRTLSGDDYQDYMMIWCSVAGNPLQHVYRWYVDNVSISAGINNLNPFHPINFYSRTE